MLALRSHVVEAAGARSGVEQPQASRLQGTAPDELPALDDSSDEDEPVSGVRIDASPGKPDFFVTLTTVDDEFSCSRRQHVMAAAFAY